MTTQTVSRRSFLGRTAALGLAAQVPLSLNTLAGHAGAAPAGPNDGLLFVVFLNGGNDSLNTFGPFNGGAYRGVRGSLKISPSKAHDVGGGMYFHPALSFMAEQYRNGSVAVIPGFGKFDGDHSHFSSTTTIMTGKMRNEPRNLGWLGRWIETQPAEVLGANVDGGIPQIMRTSTPRVIGIDKDDNGLLPTGDKEAPGNATMFRHTHSALSPAGLYFADSLEIAASFSGVQRGLYTAAFPSESPVIVGQMRRAAGVLNLGLGVRVVSAVIGGFDNHANQLGDHDSALDTLDRGLRGFFDSLHPALVGQTTVMVVSEFGRRVEPNGSNGTDHGGAGAAFFIGPKVKGGMVGAYPSLTSLDSRGNLKPDTDFRRVSATVLEDWLKADSQQILDDRYSKIDLFKSAPAGTGVAGFYDVEAGAFYAGAIRWGVAQGVMQGTTPTTMEPNRPMSRGEFSTILWRYAGSPASSTPITFSDVTAGAYYDNAIRWMASSGIGLGSKQGKFEPNRSVTRGDAATFLWRWKGKPARPAASFADVRRTDYYAAAIDWMTAEGVTRGLTPSTFGPNDAVTRAQALTFLWRLAGSPAVS